MILEYIRDATSTMSNAQMWITFIIYSLIVTEIIYLIFINSKNKQLKKKYDDSLWSHVITLKFLSFFGSILILWVIGVVISIIDNIIEYWKYCLLAVIIVTFIIVYLMLNKHIFDCWGKKESKEEYLKRMKKEKKKFIIGDKVRVRKWPFSTSLPNKKKWQGKILTVSRYRQPHDGLEVFEVKEGPRSWNWAEDQVVKLNKKKNTNGK